MIGVRFRERVEDGAGARIILHIDVAKTIRCENFVLRPRWRLASFAAPAHRFTLDGKIYHRVELGERCVGGQALKHLTTPQPRYVQQGLSPARWGQRVEVALPV